MSDERRQIRRWTPLKDIGRLRSGQAEREGFTEGFPAAGSLESLELLHNSRSLIQEAKAFFHQDATPR